MYLIIGILLFIAVLYWDVLTDYNKWKKNIPVIHSKKLIIRCLYLCPSFTLFFLFKPSLLAIPLLIGMMGSWYWEFFDGFYNKIRGFSWRFNGSDDEDDAKTDDFLQKFTPTQQLVLKWILISLFTTLYIIL